MQSKVTQLQQRWFSSKSYCWLETVTQNLKLSSQVHKPTKNRKYLYLFKQELKKLLKNRLTGSDRVLEND